MAIKHDEKPVAVIGTKKWRQLVPPHLQGPLGKALKAMDENDLTRSNYWFGQCADLCQTPGELKPCLYFGSQVATQGYFNLRGSNPHDERLDEYRDVALTITQGAVELSPDDPVPVHNLGRFYDDMGDIDNALECYREAMRLDPSQIETWGNAGAAYYIKGQVDDAWRCWDKAISLDADKASARIAQSYIWLRKGEWEKGWAAFNDRWSDLSFTSSYGRKDLDAKGEHWLGQTYRKKRMKLFLHGEQGLGDHVQFARFIPLLEADGITIVGLETRAVLKRWMEAAFPNIPVFVRDEDELPEFTHHCSTMSLPHIYGTTPETVPPPVAPMRNHRIPTGLLPSGRIGIAWEGAKGNTADALRSIPAPQLRHLADIPGVTWVSLQFAPDASITARSWLGKNVVDGTEGCADVYDTAAVIRGLDHVVTVDTLTMHLAGTLGVPSTTLHRFCREWRHLDVTVGGERCVWYPANRNYTQTAPGDWETLLKRVREDLTR